MTRRVALGTLGASAAGVLLFGPRPRGQRAGSGATLNYWEKWVGHEADAMRAIGSDFNAENPELDVRRLSVESVDQKARIAIAGGDPPDVLGVWVHNLAEYAESDAVLPLDALARDAGLDFDRYAPVFGPMTLYRGERRAVVNTASSVAMYYNRRLFRE